ncbi:Uncharacterised protein [Mycobacterium tuberculosis]|uniref:Uncharacterized protein n=1 Tax=Mycobacterium tuberculosis TaxID=1773 RepID=A0A916LGK1_MYCTX|nr:Uncharacterised protein [Mycobacterium tuberculosis]CPB58115.1 Uncharacterised protein [Mycobacterium tuberculosis]
MAVAVYEMFGTRAAGGAGPGSDVADVIGDDMARDGQQPSSGAGACGKPRDGADRS